MEIKIALFDTDFAFEYYSGNADAIKAIATGEYNFIVLCAITVAEIIKACKDKKTVIRVFKTIAGEEVLHINESISQQALNIVYQYSLSHHADISDALIPATAIHYNLHLATCNKKHFDYIPTLKQVPHQVVPKRNGLLL